MINEEYFLKYRTIALAMLDDIAWYSKHSNAYHHARFWSIYLQIFIKAWWSLIHAVAAIVTKLLLWGQLNWRKWVEIYCAHKMPHCVPLILIHILQLSSTLVLGLQMSMLLGLHHWLQADKLENVIALTVFD